MTSHRHDVAINESKSFRTEKRKTPGISLGGFFILLYIFFFYAEGQPLDETFRFSAVTIKHSVLGIFSIYAFPATGSKTKTVVDSASASITLDARTVTLLL